jgi:TPR repeat protein
VLAKVSAGIQFNEHLEGDGGAIFARARRLGCEGIVSKLRERRYKADDQGLAAAEHNLGLMYVAGQSVPQDYTAAVTWFRKAAEQQGHTAAQFNLGSMYFNGQGALQDYVLAHMWSNLAAAAGDREALLHRDFIARRMTPAQIAEAQKLAREWNPKSN